MLALAQDENAAAGACLFVNARLNATGHADVPRDVTAVQWFAPFVAEFTGAVSCVEDVEGEFDTLLMLAPKNRVEAAYVFARGFSHLKKGGRFYVAAANDAGGKSLHKMLQKMGVDDFEPLSKHKAKAVYGVKGGFDAAAINAALLAGGVQDVLGGEYVSQPGVFGWSKIDKGSELLVQHVPDDLRGKGADFGCGYGYLSRHVVQHCAGVERLYAIDADARAIACAEQNLIKSSFPRKRGSRTDKEQIPDQVGGDDGRVEFLWSDLTKSQSLPPLDFIIMNPPFHQDKAADTAIGLAFIETAHAALKTGGRLFMVANAHLPYEHMLQQKFTSCDKLHEGQGFKVYGAVK